MHNLQVVNLYFSVFYLAFFLIIGKSVGFFCLIANKINKLIIWICEVSRNYSHQTNAVE